MSKDLKTFLLPPIWPTGKGRFDLDVVPVLNDVPDSFESGRWSPYRPGPTPVTVSSTIPSVSHEREKGPGVSVLMEGVLALPLPPDRDVHLGLTSLLETSVSWVGRAWSVRN